MPGELWAIVQLAQQQSMNGNVIIFADINLVSRLIRSSCRRIFPVERKCCEVRLRKIMLPKIQSEIP